MTDSLDEIFMGSVQSSTPPTGPMTLDNITDGEIVYQVNTLSSIFNFLAKITFCSVASLSVVNACRSVLMKTSSAHPPRIFLYRAGQFLMDVSNVLLFYLPESIALPCNIATMAKPELRQA
jgi:hypothetical protein